jgi:hypothetical protein
MQTMKKSVLLLGSYPVTVPRHGGQLRLSTIQRTYEEAGWDVVSVNVYPEEAHNKAERGRNDILLPRNPRWRTFSGRQIPFTEDILSGIYASSPAGGWPSVLAKLPERPAVIDVEHPWLWPVARKLRSLPRYASIPLVYGSHNLEGPLKREIFAEYGIRDADDILDGIDTLEREAAVEADLVFAVTQQEADTIAGWGAKKVVLLPNGISPWYADEKKLTRWREKLPKFPWLLYASSAHPPNFTSFIDVIGGSLACMPPTGRLVVSGSVTEHICRRIYESKYSDLNRSRLFPLYELRDEDFVAVKTLAHGFLLPVPFGRGSNIKTAEALFSGAYVAGTRAAFRGYEKFSGIPGVYVTDTPKELQAAIREISTLPPRPPLQPGTSEWAMRQELTWKKCLENLPGAVEMLRANGQESKGDGIYPRRNFAEYAAGKR